MSLMPPGGWCSRTTRRRLGSAGWVGRIWAVMDVKLVPVYRRILEGYNAISAFAPFASAKSVHALGHGQTRSVPKSVPKPATFSPKSGNVRWRTKCPSSCDNRASANASEHTRLVWGSSGRRFKSCQPDQHHRWSEPYPRGVQTPKAIPAGGK
jgi:hypothetical protein